MKRRRFWVERIDAGVEHVTLTGRSAHHLVDVLRMRPGEEVELVDGRGSSWVARIESIGPQGVRVKWVAHGETPRESPLDLTLAMAFSRSEKMDQVVRQATELGVTRLIAFQAARSQYGLERVDRARKRERWQKIAREALCQCRRHKEPGWDFLAGLSDLLHWADQWAASPDGSLKIFGWEQENQKSLLDLRAGSPFCMRFLAVVGPEGGWSPEEAHRLGTAGFQGVHLGPRILRLETAAVALVASIQLLWGDLGTPAGDGAPIQPRGEATEGPPVAE